MDLEININIWLCSCHNSNIMIIGGVSAPVLWQNYPEMTTYRKKNSDSRAFPEAKPRDVHQRTKHLCIHLNMMFVAIWGETRMILNSNGFLSKICLQSAETIVCRWKVFCQSSELMLSQGWSTAKVRWDQSYHRLINRCTFQRVRHSRDEYQAATLKKAIVANPLFLFHVSICMIW